jgi:hypothetical protein
MITVLDMALAGDNLYSSVKRNGAAANLDVFSEFGKDGLECSAFPSFFR